jgi:DNA invertase Pin-like site-specific DNA recombinase
MKKAFGYCRVSTKRQGKSKLGLKHQERILRTFGSYHKLQLLGLFIEIASGRDNKRPILNKVLDLCKKFDAAVVVPSIDRFSRNAAFTLMHLEDGPELILANNPTADKFQKQILAVIAEKESDDIGNRTKGGLFETKQKGTKLGNANPVVQQKRRKAWKCFVQKMKPKIKAYWGRGYTTVRKLTNVLNQNDVKTFRSNSQWHISTVHKLLKELKLS